MGIQSSLDRIIEVETSPLFKLNAWRFRMLHHLWQSDTNEAAACQKQVESLLIQNSPSHYYQGVHLHPELFAYCLSDNLGGVRRVIDDIDSMASRFSGWKPTLYYAQGEYQRIRGDYPSAIQQFQQAFKHTLPAGHQCWVHLAGAYITTLVALWRFEEARTEGKELLHVAEKEELGYDCVYLKMPLALAEANLGNYENAVQYSQSVLDTFKSLGSTGLILGLAHETRARVAILMQDKDSFMTHAKLCAEHYNSGHNAALTAKYEKLMRQAAHAEFGYAALSTSMSDLDDHSTMLTSQKITDMLHSIEGPELAQVSLRILVNRCNCLGGSLYTVQHQCPVLCAQQGNYEQPDNIDQLVQNFLSSHTESEEDETDFLDETSSSSSDISEWTDHQGQKLYPILLGHYTEEKFVISGLAVLLLDPSKPFKYPNDVIMSISQALTRVKDAPSLQRQTG